jgi:LysR family transcriptional regulator, hydrogen peroxide-inducible genes activator
MEFNQIRFFLALCEELNFTRAAKRCGVAQPSLTKAIGVLERELGGPLFRRKPTVVLNARGEAVRPHFERVCLALELARASALRQGSDVASPALAVAIPAAPAEPRA